MKITVTFRGGRRNHPECSRSCCCDRSTGSGIIHLHLWWNQSIPVKIVKLCDDCSFYHLFLLFSEHSLAFHPVATCARNILHCPEGFRFLSSDAVEKLWRLSEIFLAFLDFVVALESQAGWMVLIVLVIDRVSSCVILPHHNT